MHVVTFAGGPVSNFVAPLVDARSPPHPVNDIGHFGARKISQHWRTARFVIYVVLFVRLDSNFCA